MSGGEDPFIYPFFLQFRKTVVRTKLILIVTIRDKPSNLAHGSLSIVFLHGKGFGARIKAYACPTSRAVASFLEKTHAELSAAKE